MPLILGLDPSKTTGWSIYDTTELTPKYWGNAFECGVFEMPKGADVHHTADMIGGDLTDLIIRCQKSKGRKPDFALIEGQIESMIGGSGFSALYPWFATCAIVSILGRYKIPYATAMPSTWRTGFFGERYKPPFRIVKLKKPDAKGRTEKTEWLWKDAIIDRCAELGIKLPKTKEHAHNAAEACAIAYCWQIDGIRFHAGRYQQPWIDLRTGAAEQKRRVA